MALLLVTDLPFRWVGGRLCLDYANTVAWSPGDAPDEPARPRIAYERFTRYSRIVDWGREAGVLSDTQAIALQRGAEQTPHIAAATLEGALALRELIHRLFVALIEGSQVDPAALAELDRVVIRGFTRRHLSVADGGFVWTWEEGDGALEMPLWPVALSAAELLVSSDLPRVRQCAGDDCGFLFLDTGRGPGRRWCVMAHCGNRAKARRHYRRVHDEGAAGASESDPLASTTS